MYAPKDEPTVSKMEQVDKDINVRSKEPQTCSVNGRPYDCGNCEYFRCTADEPQKKEVEWVYNKRERLWYPYSNGELLFKDEPQTDYGDYERAVEQMQHDMRYEPTYNAEDGSM